MKPDVIDSMIARMTGFLGVSVPMGTARYVGLRALAEECLREHKSPTDVIALASDLYDYAPSLWANDVYDVLDRAGLTTCDRAALSEWRDAMTKDENR